MTGRTILVTGVSRGLGLVLTRSLLKEGATVLGLARRKTDAVSSLEKETDGRFRFREIDLSDTGALPQRVFQDLVSPDTVLHGLANNAAIAQDDLATNLRADRLEELFRINVFAAMILAKGCIRNFLLHGTGGSLVHLSSICTRTGFKGLSSYGATKGALEAFSLNLAREWGPRGIRSNCVAAGFMDTEMTAALDSETRDRIHRRNSLPGPVTVEAVAEAVRFLLSPLSEGTTGESIRVDKGSL